MKLPTYQDLSKEQDRINNLPLNGRWLVTGPPGTGKTVMALYRSEMITKQDEVAVLLMYGRLLSQYTEQAVEELDIAGVVQTYHSWWSRFCRRQWGASPMIDYDFDWAEIRKLLKEKEPPAGGVPNLLIDEGQDLPVTFFVIAAHLAQHLTVFADENQRLNNEQSTLAEIREAISPTGEYALERNYRNTQKIAAVAAHFYPGGPTGIPKPPLERPAGRSVQLRRFDDVDAVSTMVANLAQSRAQDQIGVFVPTKDLVHEYVDALMEHDVPVQWYLSGAGQQVDFTDSGVFVTTWQSAKGLEFDQVFVSELQSMFFPRNTESRMRLYVLASRARDRLVFAYTGPGKLAFDSLFPGDVERVP